MGAQCNSLGSLPGTEIWIGTSGWSYPHWSGPFYPPDLPQKRWFEYYSSHFRTVEINNTFYRLPSEQTFSSWRKMAPQHFIFSIKLSRTITHLKKLKDVGRPLNEFLGRIRILSPYLGPILVQLPPRWRRNEERLEAFLRLIPQDILVAVEFRDASWFHPDIIQLLDRFGAAFCQHDMVDVPSPSISTGSFRYIRLHGPSGKYAGRYTLKQLEGWAEEILSKPAERGTFVYFNNDQFGYAVANAQELSEILLRK